MLGGEAKIKISYPANISTKSTREKGGMNVFVHAISRPIPYFVSFMLFVVKFPIAMNRIIVH